MGRTGPCRPRHGTVHWPPGSVLDDSAPRDLLRAMFDQAVAAALPARIVPRTCRRRRRAAPSCSVPARPRRPWRKAVEDHWPGPLEGLVVTRYGHAVPCERIEIVEAAHPVPDAAGEAAARRILELARGAGPDDLVLVPDLGRRLGAAGAAGRGADARGQAGGEPGAARQRRRHRRDERGREAPLGDQGRPARRRRPPGQGREPADLRHPRRRSGGDRLRADRGRPHDLRRRPRRPRALRHRAAARGAAPSRARRRRRRPSPAIRAWPAVENVHDRDAAALAGGGGRGGAAGRRDAAASSATRSRARRARSAG